MTTQQPEALRLANLFEHYSGYDWEVACTEVAAELRRLHDEVQQLKSDLSEEVLISNEMLEVKDELLAALKALVKADAPDCIKSSIWQQAFVAINKAERTT